MERSGGAPRAQFCPAGALPGRMVEVEMTVPMTAMPPWTVAVMMPRAGNDSGNAGSSLAVDLQAPFHRHLAFAEPQVGMAAACLRMDRQHATRGDNQQAELLQGHAISRWRAEGRPAYSTSSRRCR